MLTLKYLNNFEKKIDNDIYSEPKSQLHYSVIEPQAQNFLNQFEINLNKQIKMFSFCLLYLAIKSIFLYYKLIINYILENVCL